MDRRWWAVKLLTAWLIRRWHRRRRGYGKHDPERGRHEREDDG